MTLRDKILAYLRANSGYHIYVLIAAAIGCSHKGCRNACESLTRENKVVRGGKAGKCPSYAAAYPHGTGLYVNL